MPNYKNTVIYKIQCYDTDIKDVYVGSTCNYTRRKCEHKRRCNNPNYEAYNTYVYKFIRDNGGWDNWAVSPIYKFSCDSKIEKLIEERKWIEKLNSTLNRQIPSRTIKEYYETNKDKIKEYYQAYNKKNKDKCKEYDKQRYEANKEQRKTKITCECGSVVRKVALRRHERTAKHRAYIISV